MLPIHWIFLLCLLTCAIAFPESCNKNDDCGKNATCGNNKQCSCNEGFIRLIDYKSRKITCTDCKCANCNLVNEDFKVCFCKKGSIAIDGTCERELMEINSHNLENTESSSESNTRPINFNMNKFSKVPENDIETTSRIARAFPGNTPSSNFDYFTEAGIFFSSDTEINETQIDKQSNTNDESSESQDDISDEAMDSSASQSMTDLEVIDDTPSNEQNLIRTLGKIILIVCALWLLIRFFRELRKS